MIFSNQVICVTGAAGIVGQSVVRHLLTLGAKVVALTYKNRTLDLPENKDLEIRSIDLSDYKNAVVALRDADGVFHLASFIKGAGGQSDSSNTIDLVRLNTSLAMNVFSAAAVNGAKWVMSLGSSTMYPAVDFPVSEEFGYVGQPHPVYEGVGFMKRYSESIATYFNKKTSTRFYLCRSTAIYGPYDQFNSDGHVIPQLIVKASQKPKILDVWGDGCQVRDFVYVDDVVDAMVTILKSGSPMRPYNCATGRGVTIAEIAETIAGHYDPEMKIRFDPSKPTMITQRLVDVSRIEAELGWKASVDCIHEGLKRTLSWFDSQG